jgi:hypothetical protein
MDGLGICIGRLIDRIANRMIDRWINGLIV